MIVRQEGGSGGNGTRQLFIGTEYKGSVGPDGSAEYTQKLKQGRHAVKWVLKGTRFGDGGRIEIRNAKTNEPLSVVYRGEMDQRTKPVAVGGE